MRLVLALLLLSTPALADPLGPVEVTEWKSVFATVAARRTIPARARIGGTVAELGVTEGDTVSANSRIGRIEDAKLGFQTAAVQAQIDAAQAQLENAKAELARGEALVDRGVSTAQRLDSLRTQVDVVNGQLLALRADKDRIAQSQAEGDVLAPASGLVLTVPVTAGEVILPGEPVATIGTGGFFLRLQVPERYATALTQGDSIGIGEGDGAMSGTLAKVYPQIEGGRVQADIEVADLDPRFVGARIAVRLPVGRRMALAVPPEAIVHRDGLDFVAVTEGGGTVERVVVPGSAVDVNGERLIEIVSGLSAGVTLAPAR